MITKYHTSTINNVVQVAGRIRQFISDRSLKPGDRLPTHDDLSQELGIGLRRLREGLGVLEQHGVIKRNRKAGTMVAQPSLEALTDPLEWNLENMGYTYTDLVKARAGIESAAAAQAARERKARDILVMLDALEQIHDLQQQNKPDDEAEEAFHTGILQATHNPVFMIFGKLIHLQLHQCREKYPNNPVTIDIERLAKEHRDILKAIEDQQPELAGQRVYQHLTWQLDHIPSNDQE